MLLIVSAKISATDISLILEDPENASYIDGFKLIAEHKNGKSSWLNNKEQINSFSNSETYFSPGMILSSTSEQYIDIYPDFQSVINQIEAEEENLTIKGKRPSETSEGLVHQGLATRDFVRKFILSKT